MKIWCTLAVNFDIQIKHIHKEAGASLIFKHVFNKILK